MRCNYVYVDFNYRASRRIILFCYNLNCVYACLQETYKKMIEDAGFSSVTYQNLTFGTVAIHSGFKL